MCIFVFHHITLNTITHTRTSCGPSYCPERHYSNVHVLVFHLIIVNSFIPTCTYKCSILLPWIPSLKRAHLGVLASHFITVNAFTETRTSWCFSLTFHHSERVYSDVHILVSEPSISPQRTPLLTHVRLRAQA